MRHSAKRSFLSVLAISVILAMLPASFASASEAGQEPDPEPARSMTLDVTPLFDWTFDQGEVNGSTVVNHAHPEDSAGNAKLQGTATVVTDEQRGHVLSLTGGPNGTGWLSLPDHLYQEVEDELTFAVWAYIDPASSAYTRLLSSTIAEKGFTFSGIAGWQDPEFIVVAGGGTFNHRIYTGTDPEAIADYKGDVVWNAQPARGRWQHIAVTMKKDGSYDVYLDGEWVGASGLDPRNSTSGATMATVLEHFFDRDYLDALTFNDFGRSLYTSDGDIAGKFDDIRLYNVQLTAEQVRALYEETKHEGAGEATPAIITFDLADRSPGHIFHGAAGALYALSEPNVPDINTLIPIKPSHITQKPPNGIQHPTGDALRVADYFFEAGGEAVNIVIQDYYQRWYYPSRTAEEYINEAIIPVVTAVREFKEQWAIDHPGQNVDEKFIYIPFNEPEQDNTRYPQLLSDTPTGSHSRAVFNSDWLAVTNKIKEIDPGARISGPNLTRYSSIFMEDFIPFCIQNDCLPDVISWHLLANRAYNNAAPDISAFRALEARYEKTYLDLYPDRESPFPIKVDINEYAAPEEIAVPGSLVQYIARYDELKMHGLLPYWNTANSIGSLLAGQNEPNGAWWLYKWYADMTGGDMAKITVVNARNENDPVGPGLYGLASIQDDKRQVSIVFGGTKGDSTIVLNHVNDHVDSPAFLAGVEQVHVTVWRAGFTGLTGFLVEPTQILDRNYPVENGSVSIDMKLDDYTAAYFAVITPAVDNVPHEVWFSRYEAEDAEVKTNVNVRNLSPIVSSSRAASNGRIVEGIRDRDSVVQWTDITVPVDGRYRLDLIGGSGATANLRNQSNTGDAVQRINSEWFIKVDDRPSFKVVLRADYSMDQIGANTIFLDLEAGTHSISISKFNRDTGEEGQGESTLDAIELTYAGEPGALPNYRVQAEFAEYDTAKGLSRDTGLAGFEGAGYVTGYGHEAGANTRFVFSVLDDGMYDVTIRYASANSGEIMIDHDRIPAVNVRIANTHGEWQDATVRMFLRRGINLIDVRSTAKLSLDYVHAVFAGQTPIFSIEAEDATVVGTPAGVELPLIREDVFAKYASGGKYVNGITSYDGAERYLEIDNIVVPEDGIYKLVVTYANGEYAGTHSYNNNVVERYAQISINGEEPVTVFFKNTISWQQFATQTIDVKLKAGANTIRFFNNNTYDGGSNPYGGNNASGTAGFTPYTSVPNQYAPAFDRFDLYKQVTEVATPRYTITATASAKGTISPSGKIRVQKGADQTFHFTPDPGYTIGKVLVDGKEVKVSGNTYTFTNVTSNHTIHVIFRPAAAHGT